MLPTQGAQVPGLVGELNAHIARQKKGGGWWWHGGILVEQWTYPKSPAADAKWWMGLEGMGEGQRYHWKPGSAQYTKAIVDQSEKWEARLVKRLSRSFKWRIQFPSNQRMLD